jgi:hypothetical protein
MISKSNQKHVERISHSLLSGTGPACVSKDIGKTQKNLFVQQISGPQI